VLELVASGNGYVLAGDTGVTRGTPDGRGPRLTIWQVSSDGAFTEVFDRPGWQLNSLAARGATVITAGQEYRASQADQRALALVSSDGGATFAISAGWPALAESSCFGPVAIHARTAVAAIGCHDGQPEVVVAELP
jgi:hypothetical protein